MQKYKTRQKRDIQLVQKMVGFYPLEIALLQIEQGLLNGMSLHESMERHSILIKKLQH